MDYKLIIVVNLLVLMSQVPLRVNGVTLNSALLTSKGYTTSSSFVSLVFTNIDSIDPNAFNGYTQLTSLIIWFNQLPDIDFTALAPLNQKLTSLSLDNNPIAAIHNQENVNFPAVYSLSLSGIRITELDTHLITETFPNLKYFYLASYELEKLQPHDMEVFVGSKLSVFSITVKHQAYLDESYFGPVKETISQISFQSSRIESIESNTFLNLPKLYFVDLTNNSLTNLDNFEIPSQLSTLFLRTNLLSVLRISIPSVSNELSFIDLTSNKLRSFNFIDYTAVPKLKTLYLSSNPIEEPDTVFSQLDKAKNLETLYLDEVGISKIPVNAFKSFNKLQRISLNYNPISSIDSETFLPLPNLLSVSIINAQLTQIGNIFSGRTKLYEIDLSRNKIAQISPSAFANLESLQILDLSLNQLTSISKSMIEGSKKLFTVFLMNNKISYIEPGTFSNFPELNAVYLSNNQLTNLDVNMFAGCTKLRTIYLGGNSIPASITQQLCPTPLCTVYNY